jgi:N-acylglucosamine-6-phosphate 2-epimerase
MKDVKTAELLDTLKGGLIVSVQQDQGNPLNRPEVIAALAQVAAVPGVVGLRLNEPRNIRAVRAVIDLPVIGIYKVHPPGERAWITPSYEEARQLVEAGAHILAVDATERARPAGETFEALCAAIHQRLGLPVMADIATFEEGLAAARAGADLVATTLSGYTQAPFADPLAPPDLALVQRLHAALDLPVIAEGRYNTPALVRQALEVGAHAAVVGSAITRPDVIARMFVRALQGDS